MTPTQTIWLHYALTQSDVYREINATAIYYCKVSAANRVVSVSPSYSAATNT